MIKQIPGYYGSYLADEDGNIYSMKSGSLRKLKPGNGNDDRRLSVILCMNKKTRTRRVHQLILETFIGPRPNGMFACHGDNGNLDNSLANLYYALPSRNQGIDRVRDGTSNRGEKHNNVKLNEMQVRVIRRLGGLLQSEIAEIFGISSSNVSLIRNRKIWGWL